MILAISLIVVLAVGGFVTWMFWEMAGNTIPGALPPCYIRLTGDNRTDWIFAFVFLNIFTALYYYNRVYLPGKFRR